VKGAHKTRRILHLDLDPFFISVERAVDPSLRGRPVVVGGADDGTGVVAAVSAEARELGVRPGQPVTTARRLCPTGVFVPGDFESYARFSEDVTTILLSASRRVERPSADEAYVDLTRESAGAPNPVTAAEAIKDEIQRRLGLDVSLGLASSRLAARVASTWARPRGLLVVLPGYERSFLARQPVSFLSELPPHLESELEAAGLLTLGHLADADPEALAVIVGETAGQRLWEAARGEGEEPIPVTAAPSRVQEEAVVRDRRADRAALTELVESLAARAFRRLRPFDLATGAVAVEVRRADVALKRDDSFDPPLADEETVSGVARALAEPLLEPAAGVRSLQVRLTRLGKAAPQGRLFPELGGVAGGS
jgi:DNA polymerase-4